MHDVNPIRVLIIDDDEDDYFITSEYLKNIPSKSFLIKWCYKYNDALKLITATDYDIFLVDYRLGAKTGIDLIKEARANEQNKPFILLTGKGDIRIDEEAMKLGAFDYLIKADLTSEKLERAIRYSLDRAATLNELRAKEKRYRNIFDKSGDAIFVANKQFYFTEINFAFSELLHCDKSILNRVRLTDIFQNQKQKNQIIKQLSEREVLDDFEVEIKYKESGERQCILSATKEKNLEGEIYYQGILHDITLIRKAQKTTLQEEKLAATGRLVRTLAHEVRNPINNINLASEQLRTIELDEEQKLYVDIIHRNSNRINELIKELLNTSKPAEINMAEHELSEMIDRITALAEDRIKLKNITLKSIPFKEEIILKCDAPKLEIALFNILINAVESIDHDHGKIIIKTEKTPESVLIIISDNGCGIEQDHIPKLFEPYFTSKRNGIGLGLAATLNIVQAHNGSIEVTSNNKIGTVFTITLNT